MKHALRNGLSALALVLTVSGWGAASGNVVPPTDGTAPTSLIDARSLRPLPRVPPPLPTPHPVSTPLPKKH